MIKKKYTHTRRHNDDDNDYVMIIWEEMKGSRHIFMISWTLEDDDIFYLVTERGLLQLPINLSRKMTETWRERMSESWIDEERYTVGNGIKRNEMII